MAIEMFYPLSPMQQGILFHTLVAPASGQYIQQFRCEIRGNLDAVLFRETWAIMTRRHAVLRSSFVWQDVPEPVQVVHDSVDVPIIVEDWTTIPSDEWIAKEAAYLARDREKGLDPAVAPLIRCHLAKVDSNVFRYIWTYHHLVLDGWSAALIRSELASCYESLSSKAIPQLNPSGAYLDYIRWLQNQSVPAAAAFWKEYLGDYDQRHEIRQAHSEEEFIPVTGCREERHFLTVSLSGTLQAFAKAQRITAGTVLLSIWVILLSRWLQVDETVIGVTVSGRPPVLSGVERIAGVFINTLPLRTRHEPLHNFSQICVELQAKLLEIQEYGYTPLSAIQGYSSLPAGSPLFDTVFVLANYPKETVPHGAESTLAFRGGECLEQSNYPITLMVTIQPNIALTINFDQGRVSTQTASLLLSRYVILLEEALRSPDRVLRDLPLLRAEEERVVLERSSGPMQPDLAEGRCVVGMIAQYAHEQPQAIAVGSSSVELSYAELDRLSSQWAQYLIEAGCEHGSRVALCLDRTPAVACLMVAVWKAGAVLVTLDPAYPVDRLASILRDAGVGLIVASRSIVSGLEGVESRLICLEEVEDDVVCLGGRDRSGQVDPHSTAYLIYTSGSTGVPKGVMISHASLSAVLRASAATFDIQRDDVMACVSSFAFDISLWELFLPLTCGARSIILRRDEVLATDRLAARLGEFTLVHAVPSLMWELLKAVRELEPDHRPRSLRQAFVGGDRVPPRLVEEMYEILPVQQVHVLYGPTETSIICASYRCDRDQKNHGAMIGRPLPNMNLRIYDQWGKLVPDGWIGELWLSGPQLAQGYYGRDDLTLERFVLRDGIQQYRTGDLARRLRDGSLEFMGRADRQTKIRGHRIEPGEIETILLAHPAVMQAIVLASELPSGEHRLAAYVTPNAGAQLATNELKRYLAIKLPSYMVPTTIQVLEALPLLPNGKVNQRALESETNVYGVASLSAQPNNDIERILANLISELIGIGTPNINVEESFFEQGIHSLLLIQLHNRIRASLSTDVEIVELFQYPTIRQLADRISTIELVDKLRL